MKDGGTHVDAEWLHRNRLDRPPLVYRGFEIGLRHSSSGPYAQGTIRSLKTGVGVSFMITWRDPLSIRSYLKRTMRRIDEGVL